VARSYPLAALILFVVASAAAAESVPVCPPTDWGRLANQPAMAASGFLSSAPGDAGDFLAIGSAEPPVFDSLEAYAGSAPVQLSLRDRNERSAADRVLLAGLASGGGELSAEGPFWGGPIDPTAFAIAAAGLVAAGLFLRTRLEYRTEAEWLPAPA
jgi:hypothetical protein